MVDITAKSNTLRYARASALVRLSAEEAVQAIRNNTVPKGNVFEMSRAAALLAIKKTSDVIPDCHPIPIEFASVHSTLEGMEIHVVVEVKTIYKTGVEVEAMHGASVAALTLYDMLKPLDKNIEIGTIKLLEKKGGKSSYAEALRNGLRAAVIVCSDSVSAGKKEDRAGKVIVEKLQKLELQVAETLVIPDEAERIQKEVRRLCDEQINLIITTGGTGLSPRDITPEAIRPMLTREIPGIAETMRSYGQQRTPYSMLSRSVAGFIGNTLVLALPGSTKGAEESMDALFPHILHLFRVLQSWQHEE